MSMSDNLRIVNNSPIKKDAMALVTGQPVYTDDLAPAHCLIVKVLRSPHANALIKSIDKSAALAVPGIACVLTWEDAPKTRFTIAGQTFPEYSPYDRLILDRHVRFVGDAVALVAGDSEKLVEEAMKKIVVDYDVLEPLLDFKTAKDNPVVVHPEDDWRALCEVGADNRRNLVSSGEETWNDVDSVMADCDIITEAITHTIQNQQGFMETFRAVTYLDMYDRLTVVSSTQIPFHVRRILAIALEIPQSRIRVIKPRIGGGFGAKQTAVCEMYPALVTMVTKKAAKIIYTRYESQIASSPRHESEVRVRIGADKDGKIRAAELESLFNTGAYSEQGPTTVTLSGHKSLPLYGSLEAFRFTYDVVYTNKIASGAYRGYGAPQGTFPLESAVNELAEKLEMDPSILREMNMVREGQFMPAYFSETATSCALDRCLLRAKEMIGWNEKYPVRDVGDGKVRALGISFAMQGSGIASVDTGAVSMKLNDDGFYTLAVGCADMGMGCDTVLTQIAAECLECEMSDIVVHGVDTDISPYDTGSYASSSTYITGMAVLKTCEALKGRMLKEAAKQMQENPDDLAFEGSRIRALSSGKTISIKELARNAKANNCIALYATEAHASPTSPPPYIVGIAEIEMELKTCQYELINYVAVIDCGTVVNPNLARVQAEGGLLQGIGMAMFEDVRYSAKGAILNDSFMQYKLPSRLDTCNVQVAFESSYESTGPYGAKSIGEVVITTPAAAIAHAVRNAAGVWIRELPITPEKIYLARRSAGKQPG